MNDNAELPINNARILAAMRAVNPPLEKLMAERLDLRIDNRQTKAQLHKALTQVSDLQHIRDVQMPRYIAAAKLASLSVATILLGALATALFTHLLDINITASLFASLILPLWLVDVAERTFGRWVLGYGMAARFVPTPYRMT